MSLRPTHACAAFAVAFSITGSGAGAEGFDGVYEYAFCDDPPYVALTI